MPTKSSALDISNLHSLERNLEAKLRRQASAVDDTTAQLEAVKAMLQSQAS